MGRMKDIVIRLMNGGEDAVAACHDMMPRWIPVSERLPFEAPKAGVGVTTVFVCDQFLGFFDGEVHEVLFTIDDRGEVWWHFEDEHVYPTHWMHLPEGPTT